MAQIFTASYIEYRRDPRGRRQAEALVEAGHDVVFMACQPPGSPKREYVDGVEVLAGFYLSSKPTSFIRYLMHYARFFFAIMFHLCLHPKHYDLIHIHNMPDFLVLAAWLPRILGVPVIHDILDLMPEIYMEKFEVGPKHWAIRLLKLQERVSAGFASAVLTVEERLVDILEKRGIPRKKMSVVLNLPDERIFAPREPRQEKPKEAHTIMAYHGTLAHRLGLDLAILAMAQIKDEIPNLRFKIIGGGEELESLKRLSAEVGLSKQIWFSDGYVPIEDVPELLDDVDFGIVPMRQLGATDIILPTKLLEYVQMGIPVIAPTTGTVMRYFDDTMVRFFEPASIPSLAQAIQQMYDNPGARADLSKNAQTFTERYHWSEHKHEYLNLVDRLLPSDSIRTV